MGVSARKTLVIGEPGCTAEGDFATMVRMVHVAADAGCDVYKSQWTSDAEQMIARRKVPADPYRKYYGWLQYPLEWHRELRAIAQSRGLQYACSVYLPQDIATIAPFVDLFKISSFEADDLAMAQALKPYRKSARVMISDGMTQGLNRGAIRKAMGGRDARIWWLHCVSAYPAPLDALNLRVLSHPDWDDLPMYAGYSDHSRHVLAGALAVACGADIVETHFRLADCDPENPDYAVAFDPDGFAAYIENIREAEIMAGDGIKRVQSCEQQMLAYKVTA